MTSPAEDTGGRPSGGSDGLEHAELRQAVREKNQQSQIAANLRKDPPWPRGERRVGAVLPPGPGVGEPQNGVRVSVIAVGAPSSM